MVIGIYKNKLLFFLALTLAIFYGPKLFDSQSRTIDAETITADIADNGNMSDSQDSYYLELFLLDDGSVRVGNRTVKESIKPKANADELRYIILNQPEEYYSNLQVVLNLPRKLNKLEADPEIIAVHGAEAIGTTFYNDKIVYRAKDVGPESTVTIVALFPKGYINLPANKKIQEAVGVIPASYWLIISLVFPFLAALILVGVILKTRNGPSDKAPTGLLNGPPTDIPPAVVGALVDGRVGPRTIAATLVDLAQRDFIEIYNRGEDFVIFLKNAGEQKTKLKMFEQILLDKIFMPKQKAAGSFDVEARVARHLFSKKVAVSYLDIYNEGKKLGYFNNSPATTHLRFRLIGIITFYLGLVGYAISAFLAADPKYVLFFWISLVIFGVLIINFAPKITIFSPSGIEQRKKWLMFKNYLSDKSVISPKEEQDFEKYLPYAIVLGVEADWAARFIEENFVKPDWYDYIAEINGIEYFAKTLLPIIDYIGKTLDSSSDPLVK